MPLPETSLDTVPYKPSSFAKIVLIPNALLVPGIVLLSFLGSFAMRNRMEDVLITIVFGLIGYLLHKVHWPAACMVLGLVLGDLVESNFHRALRIGDDAYSVFFTRPISLVLLICTLIFLLWPFVSSPIMRSFRRPSPVSPASGTDSHG